MSLRRRATALLGLSVAIAGVQSFALTTAQANPAGTGLVISEVYGAGGNTGSVFNADFVELYNPTGAALSVNGLGLQYRSASGGSGGITTLPNGSVQPGGRYLVQLTAAGAAGAPLPTPDYLSTTVINVSGTNGQVLLLPNATFYAGPAGNIAGSQAVLDMVGFGSTPTTFEGAVTGVEPTVGVSPQRAAAGTDTDNNANDFSELAPTPTASGGGTMPPPAPVDNGTRTIAQIQGPGASSPLTGTVTTSGVVTAAYPSGGLFGFYLQTQGTGGPSDLATRTTSDGIFVRQLTSAGAVTVRPGQFVQVKGTITEFAAQTQIEVDAAADITIATGTFVPPTPTTTTAWPATAAQKEALEGMVYRPGGTFTVTDNFNTNQFGELGLAQGDRPLIQPTDVALPGSAQATAVANDNAARAIVLDDASSTNFQQRASNQLVNGAQTPPYISNTAPIRVGATGRFDENVILTQGGSSTAPTYRFQPLAQVVGNGDGAAPISFADTRQAAPDEAFLGDADLKVASFNVLNYFTTLGDADNDNTGDNVGGVCAAAFPDRTGDGNSVSGGCRPRGAWDPQDLTRQQTKIVAAINALDADIVGLMEIENSLSIGETADEATNTLVAALNARAGAGTWAANPSSSELPPAASMDVITNAIIYRTAAVGRLGEARALGTLSDSGEAFGNAREPIAQAFTPVAGGDPVMVVVNHFKSKSADGASGANADTGQGAFNADRTRQAEALRDWVPTVQGPVEDVLLLGDFNAYGFEDPMTTLYSAGYADVEKAAGNDEYSYSFSGLAGSLDHILMNRSARQRFSGADIWNINGVEPIALEYSRFNYHATGFHTNGPWRSSDHDPVIVGLSEDRAAAEINLLNINDFHGRIDENTTKVATTIERLRAEEGEDNTLFLSAGDNIGASLFASSVEQDNPTIDVLNALELATSAIGNHELDKGFDDLNGRVRDRADWSYLGANVYRAGTQTPVLDEYDLFEVDGVSVAVVGVVTQETPTLVTPTGIEGLEFGEPVAAVNRVAARLSDGIETRNNDEADVILAEYHEGAPEAASDGVPLTGESAVFDRIINQTTADVDAIFTGHTHRRYAFAAPVPGATDGSTRPVVQTGSYGESIGQVRLTVDRASGDVTAHTERTVSRVAAEDLSFPRVVAVKQITDAALANAAAVGNRPVGTITADITTAFSGGTYVNGRYTVPDPRSTTLRDNRTAESTLGDTVANALRDGVSDLAEPDLGLTNSGGLRAELLFAGDTASNPANTDGVVTFAEANAVLPFNNTVAIVELTGAQLKQVLEQQYQTDANGNVPSRAYAQLGMSDNVRVTADPTAGAGSRITSVFIDDVALDPTETYTISTLSFLAAGGDNFRAFTQGTFVDTGLLDAELFRNFLAAGPATPDFARQQVFATGLPQSLVPGEPSVFTLGPDQVAPAQPNLGETIDLTSLGSPANTQVVATIGGATVGSFTVNNGTAEIDLTVPTTYAQGVVTLTAQPSGTTVTIPFGPRGTTPPTTPPTPPTTPVAVGTETSADVKPNRVVVDRTKARVRIEVEAANGAAVTGVVTLKLTGVKAETVMLVNGKATITLDRFKRIGRKRAVVTFLANAAFAGSKDRVNIYVKRR